MRERVDTALVRRGLARSRSQAQGLLAQGAVTVDGEVVRRSSARVAPDTELRVDDPAARFVGRGARKLDEALKRLPMPVEGRVALDAGASTGGFTQVLLERGASKVYAVDVGRGQLHEELRLDARVAAMEETDIRSVVPQELSPRPQIAVADLSYISLHHVLPALAQTLADECDALVLVKPQFECGPGAVDRRGVVRSADQRAGAVIAVAEQAQRSGLTTLDVVRSAVPGSAGNIEYFLWLRRGSEVAACPIAHLRAQVGKDESSDATATPGSAPGSRPGESEET